MQKNITNRIIDALKTEPHGLGVSQLKRQLDLKNMASLRSTVSILVERGVLERVGYDECAWCARNFLKYRLVKK